MSDIKQAQAIFAMAQKDWEALREMVGNPVIADEIYGFHAQQAVKKSLKAWIALRSLSYPRTHNLILLLDMLDDDGAPEEEFWDLVSLNSYAVQFRYEASEPDAERLDRGETLRQVTVLVEHVQKFLVGEATG